MRTIAVTIGVEAKHAQLAQWSAQKIQQFLNLETQIVGGEYLHYAVPNLPHPKNIWSLKFSLFDIFPDADRIMYFDCDWRPVRAFNLDDYCADPGQLYFVPDRGEYSDHVVKLAARYGLQPHEYFNAGWFVAHRQHLPLFQACKNVYRHVPEKYGDQCVMNQVLRNCVTLLPRKLNVMDFGAVPAHETLGFHNGSVFAIAANEMPDYDWNAGNSAVN